MSSGRAQHGSGEERCRLGADPAAMASYGWRAGRQADRQTDRREESMESCPGGAEDALTSPHVETETLAVAKRWREAGPQTKSEAMRARYYFGQEARSRCARTVLP
jgi:hypothetical protein